jgi:hypothetical protein
MRCSFGHSPCSATSTESSFFAAEGDEPLVIAIDTPEAQESVCQYAALEKSLEFLRHMLWKMFTLLTAEVFEASQVFLHDFVEQGAFGAAPDVAGIVPRKGCLPMGMDMRTLRGALALLLHFGLALQAWSHECSRIPLCRSR